MTLNLTIEKTVHTDFQPRITVIGVGGGGTNAVNNMIAMNLPGVEFIVANTDAQQLQLSRAERRIQLGPHITQGNGAGGRPEVGKASADEAAEELVRHMDNAHMVFITAGMGGGTGTGAAPVIARMARERNILTVGVVTKPFSFEGRRRMRIADEGIAELQQYVDTLIVIPNQNLFKVANERTGWKEAFEMADNVLYMGVRGVTDLMVVPGLVNLDYADIRSVMSEMGKAMMGTGEADGPDRAVRAAEAAISNPLLEDTNMKGARGLLINITGGADITLFEIDQAANRIREEVDEDANIMVGMALDESLSGRIRLSVVATGIDSAAPASNAERPRLVAVANGGMVEAPAPYNAPSHGGHGGPALQAVGQAPAQASMSAHMAPMPGQGAGYIPTPPNKPLLSSAFAAPPAEARAPQPVHQAMPQQQAPQQQPVQMEAAAAQQMRPQPMPQQAPRAAPPAEAPKKGGSLFAKMTASFRSATAPQPPAHPRHEPQPMMAAPQPQGHQAHAPQPLAPQPHGHQAPDPYAEPQREPVRAAVRPAQIDEIGLEIPAFLRRSS